MARLLSKQALLLNFTANNYHWGCFGTSHAVYERLIEAGYYVNTLPADACHGLAPTPSSWDDFLSDGFFEAFAQANPLVMIALRDADLVVVNGEGTMHGRAPAPMNILYVLHILKHRFRKTTRIINHSCFPSDFQEPMEPVVADIYRQVYHYVDYVAVRDARSLRLLASLGVQATLAFDCLPLFIRDHYPHEAQKRGATILLSGGFSITTAPLCSPPVWPRRWKVCRRRSGASPFWRAARGHRHGQIPPRCRRSAAICRSRSR